MTSQHPNPADPIRSGRALPGSSREPDSELVRVAVERAKAGDTGALQFLYIRYADDIRRYVTSIVGDHHEAEDIMQGVFLKLMRVLGSYTQRDVPFVHWLLRVARNAAVDSLRSKRAVPVDEIRESGRPWEEPGSWRLRELRAALDRLPSEQRQVLVLRHVVGLTPGEIARVLDKTESAVHGLHHRARSAVKGTLREREVTPRTMP